VLVYDDDHNNMANVLCERMRQLGKNVIFATPSKEVASWTQHTMEQGKIYAMLLNAGIPLHVGRKLTAVNQSFASLTCTFTEKVEELQFGSLLLVTSRIPDTTLYSELIARRGEWADYGIKTVHRIGDCVAPAMIATAVFAGHEFARTFEENTVLGIPFRRGRTRRNVSSIGNGLAP
jgi:dimethylamine/trimethylamine dehydrogenase